LNRFGTSQKYKQHKNVYTLPLKINAFLQTRVQAHCVAMWGAYFAKWRDWKKNRHKPVKTLILKELCYRCEQKGTGFIADHHTQHDRLNGNTDAKHVH